MFSFIQGRRKLCVSHAGDSHCIADVIRRGFVRLAAAQSRGQLGKQAVSKKMFNSLNVLTSSLGGLIPFKLLYFIINAA